MRTSSINMEGTKMKIMKLIIIAMLFSFAACTTSSNVYDDIYYSRKGSSSTPQVIATAPQTSPQAKTVSSNSNYEYQTYYQEGVASEVQTNTTDPVYSTTETVVEPDGTTYSTTETYYNSEYAQRMRRFSDGGSSSFGYYDNYNTGCFDCSGSYLSMGFGYPYNYGWSMGYSFGWPSYYGYSPYWGYDSFYYSPWSYGYGWRRSYGYWGSYGMGYNHGFYDGYYYGGGYGGGGYGWDYPSNRRPNTYYGHRGSNSGGTTVPSGSARGNKTEQNQNTSYSSDRGVRSSDAANMNKTTDESIRGTTSSNRTREGQVSSERTDRGAANTVRTERPVTETRNERPAVNTRETRPSAQERVNDYRQRYDRPATQQGQSQNRTQQYERPKTYTSPSVRQPKSSNEYVRPQAEPNRSSGTNRTVNPVQSAPSRSTTVQPQSQPNRSTGTARPSQQPVRSNPGNVSQPSRSSNNSSGSVSQPSRSSSVSSPPPSSSGSSSGSSGSSRGSSSGSSSSGGRR